MLEHVHPGAENDHVRRRGYAGAWLFIILPLSLYFIVQAVLSGMAYIDQYRLNATVDRWDGRQSIPSISEWKTLDKMALAALHGNESNADIVNATGRLYEFRSYMASSLKEKDAFGRKAIEYYKRVTRLRPAWPYGWMNLAESKARLGEVDMEFRHALMQLLHLAPWEKNTLPSIFQLSLFAWPYLDSANRRSFLDYFIVAQESRERDVYKVLKKSGQMKLYCSIISHEGDKASFCP